VRIGRFCISLSFFSLVLLVIAVDSVAQPPNYFPGLIQPSGCRVGAVLSLEHFASSGYSSVRTASPNGEYVGGAWVVANNYIFSTAILQPPNCTDDIFEFQTDDDLGMNLMAVRIFPTIGSAEKADIREIKLVWDVNLNGHWDPLLDLVLQTRPGTALDSMPGAIFYNGPQNPLAILTDTEGFLTPIEQCNVLTEDSPPNLFPGPVNGTNTRFDIDPDGTDGCYIGLLAVLVIGNSPQTGTQLGLSLEAYSGDIPGSTGISSHQISSGFSSSRNPSASNTRLQMIGGDARSPTPLEHLSNSSGGAESDVEAITFTGGRQGEGLLSRFRALTIIPGTREVIAMAVAICDGGSLANTEAPILPEIPGAAVQIAGGLATLVCVPSNGTDGFATGINGATLIFRGSLARYMGTVRMYADECSLSQAILGNCVPTPLSAGPPTLATIAGGGDGVLFQPGENVIAGVPSHNAQTNEAIVRFGPRQEQVLFTNAGEPIAAGSDPACRFVGICAGPPLPTAGSRPLILIFTVDIDSNAPSGQVDVLLSLTSFDDTAISLVGDPNPCFVFGFAAGAVPFGQGGFFGAPGVCASNFLDLELEQNSFAVVAPAQPSTSNNLTAYDTNNSCFIDDPEMFDIIDGWIDREINEDSFFGGVDYWVMQSNICIMAASSAPSALRLEHVKHEQRGFGSMTFTAVGNKISQISLKVIGLDGVEVFHTRSAGTSLSWDQRTRQGAPVANGTYLYVVEIEDAHGNAVQSGVQKLVVLR